jgi:2-polyprenyl-3-methyl-5-hydroxy-6-metoxy-1,4-benzoquinol methylase
MKVMSPLDWSSISEFLGFWLSNAVLDEADQRTFDYYYRSYKKHFGPYLQHYYERQTRELMTLVRSIRQAKLLEVGCGCGTEAVWAALHGASVTGIDICAELLAVAQHRLAWLDNQIGRSLQCRFLRGSIFDLDDGPFDVVYIEQALHHIEPREVLIEKLSTLIAPCGHLIISEANGWNPFLQVRLFHMRGIRTIITHDGHMWGHERITVPWALIRQFRRHGLIPVALNYYRALPNVAAADKLLSLDRALPQILRPLFTHFNLMLRKRP